MSPEFRFLVACIRDDPPEVLEALLAAVGPDVNELLRLAGQHWVISLLYTKLRTKGLWEQIPSEAQRRLEATQLQLVARQTRMVGTALEIIEAFRDAGIRAMPLKGTAMIALAWPDYLPRNMGDLDLLLELDAVEAAARVLADLGFAVDAESFRFRPWSAHPLKASRGEVAVDVHTSLWGTTPVEPRRVSPESLWSHTRPGTLLDHPVLVLSPEHLLLTHLAGMAKDRFDTLLRSWMDLAWLFSAGNRGLDPSRLAQTAATLGCLGLLRLCVDFAQELLGTDFALPLPRPADGRPQLRARRVLWSRLLQRREISVPRGILRLLAGGPDTELEVTAAGQAVILEQGRGLARWGRLGVALGLAGAGIGWCGRLAVSSAERQALREEHILLLALRGS